MLGKLFKQEIKSQGRIMLVIYGILAVAAVLMSIFGFLKRVVGNAAAESIFGVSGSLFVFTVIICTVSGFIYLCMHFYQSMYSAQGYLTHTLPVKTEQILYVKVIVSAGSLFLTMAVCMLSLCAAITAWDGIGAVELMSLAVQALDSTGRELNMHGAVLLLYLAVIILLSCFGSLLMFFAGSSIGQLAKRSKGVCGAAAGIGLYYICQIITFIVVAAAGVYLTESGRQPQAGWFMFCAAAAILFWSVVFYLICRVIALKHLNLE